jgi:hypothetical protein
MGIVGAARSAFLVTVDPADPEKRVLVHYKSSLGPPSTSLSFMPQENNGGLTIRWLGEIAYSDRDFGGGGNYEAPALNEAKRFLYSVLTEEKLILVRRIKHLARDAGISDTTLKRAKLDLGVKSLRKGFGRGSVFCWLLVETRAVAALRRQELDELAEQLCHGSPLDEISLPPAEEPERPAPPIPPNIIAISDEDDSDDDEDDEDEDSADWWKKG